MVAIIVALIVGWLSFYHGASPLYASVVSLVLPIVVAQLLYSGGQFTGSSSGLSGFDSFDVSIEAWFWIAGAFLVVATAAAYVFVRSDVGRVLVAIRENEARCEYLGIHVSRIKIRLLVVLAAIAAIAGFAFAGVQMVVAPEYAGFVFGTELVIWVALGGRGTLIGPVIGTLLIDVEHLVPERQPAVSVEAAHRRHLRRRDRRASARVVADDRGPEAPVSARQGRACRAAARSAPCRRDPVAGLQSARQLGARHRQRSQTLRQLASAAGHSFKAQHGELLSLVGPNGAAKPR